MKKLPAAFFLVLFISFFILFPQPSGAEDGTGTPENVPEYEYVRGEVTTILAETTETSNGEKFEEQEVRIKILGGLLKGEERTIKNTVNGPYVNPAYSFRLAEGDSVILAVQIINGEALTVEVDSISRDSYIKWLIAAFCTILIILGRLKGLKSLLSLGLTIFLLIKVMLPLILKGHNPLLLAILVSAAVSIVTIFTIGGLTGKSMSATLGTVGGVFIAGLIAYLIGIAAQLTGFAQEEVQMLMYIPQEIDLNFKGLLFAGIVIGSLGAVMDVGMSVASAVEEVKRANPTLSREQLFKAGINVGRDIMGTMSNTLVLAYTGAAMPLILLFMAYETPALRIFNLDSIVTEIVRALAGSIGLILAIPITAFFAAILTKTAINPGKKEG